MGVRVPSSALNMASTITKLPDGTITLKITIPFSEVKKTREVVLEELAKNAKVAGFRKGKAPKKLVEEKIDPTSVREEVLRTLLPKFYIEATNEHKLRPIMDPKVHIPGALTFDKDWEFEAVTCEAPEVDLNGYKAKISNTTAKSKIIVPGKEPEKPKIDELIKVLLENVKVIVPKPIIDREVDRLLSQTLDEIKRLGLTLDQYLASTNKTPETLRADYGIKASSDLKLEFALQKIAEVEKITVEEKDLQATIEKAKTPEERQNLEANKYLLASILRQQKTLDFLASL